MAIPDEDLGPVWLRDWQHIDADIQAMEDFANKLRADVETNYASHLTPIYDDMSTALPYGGFSELDALLETHHQATQSTTNLVHDYANRSAGMAQAPGAASTQPSVMLTFPAVQPAGTLVYIAGPDGQNVLTFAPPKAFQSLVLSSPALEMGATYRVYTGGGATGAAVDGLYAAGPQGAGTEFVSFTVTGPVTRAGAAAAGGVRRR